MIPGRDIYHMEQYPAAGQMLQKANTQASPFSRTLDQAGYIGHHKTAQAIHLNHAQIGHQRCKGIICHFRLGGRHRSNQRGFTRIGHTQQTDIRQHLQLKAQITLFAFCTWRGFARCPVCTGFKTGITQAAAATFGHHKLLALSHQITQHLFGVFIDDGGAHGHFQHQIIAAGAGAIAARTTLATLSFELTLIAIIHQRV